MPRKGTCHAKGISSVQLGFNEAEAVMPRKGLFLALTIRPIPRLQ